MNAPNRRPAVLLFSLAAALCGSFGMAFDVPTRPLRRREPPAPPQELEGPPAPPEPCPWHDADGRRCELGVKHGGKPWTRHSHADGWKEQPESRQVRRARERAEAKSKKRRNK